jgi:hypothetical protein
MFYGCVFLNVEYHPLLMYLCVVKIAPLPPQKKVLANAQRRLNLDVYSKCLVLSFVQALSLYILFSEAMKWISIKYECLPKNWLAYSIFVVFYNIIYSKRFLITNGKHKI